jgi:hypothetical protein
MTNACWPLHAVQASQHSEYLGTLDWMRVTAAVAWLLSSIILSMMALACSARWRVWIGSSDGVCAFAKRLHWYHAPPTEVHRLYARTCC